MFVPDSFAIDEDAALTIVADAGFVQLVSSWADGFDLTPLPVIVDRASRGLRAHLARANPQWRRLVERPEAVAICAPVDGYVSPSWYPSKAEHGRVVPTWNYVTVACHGTVTVHDDPEWVLALVRELSDRHEAGRAEPWSVDDAPADFLARQARSIVGIEVHVDRIEGKAKLSQNRPTDDREGVLEGLAEGSALAAVMRRLAPIRADGA